MIQIVDKALCCGCTACAGICPQNSITMKPDAEGFLYPVVDACSCVDCGLCSSVCPVNNVQAPAGESQIMYLQHTDADVRKASTSGGAFYALAQQTLKSQGVVFAAGYDEQLQVVHKCAATQAQLQDMMMSKYVQSELSDIFHKVKEAVVAGKQTLFVGTPCQVQGLVQFLKNVDTSKLLAVDLECYGVPSPGLYRLWLQTLEKRHGQKVKQLYFRDKKYGYAGVNVKVILEDGKVIEDKTEIKTFTKTMFSGIGLRPSCYQCPFRNAKRDSDITLGDAWDVKKCAPKMDDDQGTTKLIVHTEKGKLAVQMLEHVRVVSGEKRPNEEQYGKNKEKHPHRDVFFDDVNKRGYEYAVDKHIPASLKDKAANVIKPIMGKMPCSSLFFKALKKAKRWKGK